MRNASEQLFSRKRMKSYFKAAENYAGHKAYLKKKKSFFAILLQSLILFKNINKSWADMKHV